MTDNKRPSPRAQRPRVGGLVPPTGPSWPGFWLYAARSALACFSPRGVEPPISKKGSRVPNLGNPGAWLRRGKLGSAKENRGTGGQPVGPGKNTSGIGGGPKHRFGGGVCENKSRLRPPWETRAPGKNLWGPLFGSRPAGGFPKGGPGAHRFFPFCPSPGPGGPAGCAGGGNY